MQAFLTRFLWRSASLSVREWALATFFSALLWLSQYGRSPPRIVCWWPARSRAADIKDGNLVRVFQSDSK